MTAPPPGAGGVAGRGAACQSAGAGAILPLPDHEGRGDIMAQAKTLLLTGAGRGIGHATVRKFSAEGWRVITCSRQPFPEQCPWGGGAENHVQVDLSDPRDTIEKVEQLRARLGGRLDALVNNAGVSPKGPGGERLNTIDTDLSTWGHVFHVNFFASVVLARALKDELAACGGAVVNVTSIAGSRVHPFAGAAYATSKAALKALTREMAHDFGPLGVRVNAIAPGEIETEILSPGTEAMVGDIPLRRLGRTEEVADTIYFLCSDGSRYISGTEIEINGGQHV